MVVDVPASGDRPTRQHVRQPIEVRGVETTIRRHVPDLGQDTRAVLSKAGYGDAEIRSLREVGIIEQADSGSHNPT